MADIRKHSGALLALVFLLAVIVISVAPTGYLSFNFFRKATPIFPSAPITPTTPGIIPPPSTDKTYTFSLTESGTGAGDILVTLTPSPSSGSTFGGWGGDCSGTGSCSFTLNSNKKVSTIFDLKKSVPTPVIETSVPSPTFTSGAPVAITANINDAAGTSRVGVQLEGPKSTRLPYGREIRSCTVSGTTANCNTGPQTTSSCTFTSSTKGVCKFIFSGLPEGTYTYSAWEYSTTGAYNAASPESFVVTSAGASYGLTVGKYGNGDGSVSSNPTGINCGSDCSENYADGTSVTLTATPAAGSTFSSWSGDCSGTSSWCTLIMDSNKEVTATFNKKATYPTISVSHSPENPTVGQTVTLTATAASDVSLTHIIIAWDNYWQGSQKYCSVSGTTATCTQQLTFNTAGTHTYFANTTDASRRVARDPPPYGTKSFTVS